MRHVVVGTAGHIDHGKSALVQALTGTDPDRLKEEKLRGITIDLGFAHMDLGDVQIAFVDVPGHERFVKNMLAGAGGIDLVLLVVAADESVMPQTREHFDICRLLGIRSGLVVITKIDAVEPDLVAVVREEIRDLVQGSFLEGSRILEVSSRTGAGTAELKEAIRDLGLTVEQRPRDRLLRLPIDRAFTIRGFGTVVTGTLLCGEIAKDQEVELIPGEVSAKVRGIQIHGNLSQRAVAGQRTAVNLQGIDLREVQRGMVLTLPKRFRTSRMLDVALSLLPSAPRPLKSLVKVRFHHGTSEVLARVALLGRDTLPPGESGFAQLRLDSPVFSFHDDPFIIRQFSPAVTIGGGKVLNPHPDKHRSTDRTIGEILRNLESGSAARLIRTLVVSRREQVLDLRELNSCLGWSEERLLEECRRLAEAGRILLIPAPVPILTTPELEEKLKQDSLAHIRNFHATHPLLKGISKEELRKRVFDGLPIEVFRHCLDGMENARQISQQEEILTRYGHEVQLSAEAEGLRRKIEELFRSAGFQPPLVSELPALLNGDEQEIRKLFFWMLKEKIIVKISDEFAYHRDSLTAIKSGLRSRFSTGEPFGVGEFKEIFGLTRKHAIPLLEYLDRERFTRRTGNDRVLAGSGP